MAGPLNPTAPYAKLVRMHFGGPLRRARLAPVGKRSACYWNASNVARQRGGEVVCGYLVTDYDGVMLEGLHHAVVKMPNGELVDVTPYEHGAWPYVSFVPDGSDLPSLEVPSYLDNVYVPLKEHGLVGELASAHHEACVAQRHRAKVLSCAGITQPIDQPVAVDRNKLPDLGKCLDQEREAIRRFRDLGVRLNAVISVRKRSPHLHR